MQRAPYRPDIDGLRAVAVLSVVGFHVFPYWIKGGLVGVDIFFVVSGFLISGILFAGLERGGFDFAGFYARRVRRIFPALLVVLLAAYGAGWFVLLADEFKQLGKHIAGAAGFVANLVLWNESGYFDRAAETKPLLHLWSLGIEEQFYLAWPLLLWLGWKLRAHLLALTLGVLALSFAFNVVTVAGDNVAAFYSPLTRFWELLVGAALARQRMRWPDLSLPGAALIVVALLLVDPQRQFPGWWALLPTVGAALVIASGEGGWLNRVVLSNRPMVGVGLISYPLYLWHWPLLSFARIVEGDTPSRTMRLAAIAAAVVLSGLTYVVVERPIRFGRHQALAVPLLAAAMIGCGVLGYHAFIGNGVPGRFAGQQAEMQALLAYDYFGGRTEAEFRGERSCFLVTETVATFEKDGCETVARFPGRPKIFLVGDSHAAYLGRGLAPFLVAREVNVSRFFAAKCAPFALDDKSARCREIARYVRDRIEADRPDLIILFADYMQYPETPRLEGKLMMVGQIPTWKDSLPKALARRFALRGRPLPMRTYDGIVPESLEMDGRLRDRAGYLSLRDFLCDPSGCLTAAGPDIVRDLLVFDYGHLTQAGADRIVQGLIAPAVEPIVGR